MATPRPTVPPLKKQIQSSVPASPTPSKSIDLRRRRDHTPPSEDLLRRVTPQVPPSRQPIPMTKTAEQQLPLPPGVVSQARSVSGRSFEHMTEMEQRALLSEGYDPNTMPLPANAYEILQAVNSDLGLDKAPVPNIDPRQPPVQIPEPVPYSQRDPEHQARLRKVLEAAVEQEQAELQAQEEEARLATLPPGVADAKRMAQAMAQTPSNAEVDVDVSPQQPAAAAPAQQPPPQPAPAADDTGAAAAMKPHHCEMCGHPSNMPATPEPPYEKKLAFLHTILGEVNFKDEMKVMGGNLSLTFRTLTTRELQQVFLQANRDVEKKRISTTADYYEKLNWYRLCLQLVEVRGVATKTIMHVAPEGLSPETNNLATSFWECDPPEDGETILTQISDYIETNVLKTEHLLRIVGAACNQFNRLVAKLEANLENSDFWQPTAGQS